MREDEGRLPQRPRHLDHPPPRVPPRPARVTGVQVAIETQRRLLEGWREQLSPHELAVVIDIAARIVDAELRRNEQAMRRWAA